MPYDIGLAHRIRARGVQTTEMAGWQTNGSEAFFPRGSGNHHTAGSPIGAVPSLAISLYGRPGVPGPLYNVLIGRDLIAYVLAAGRANHAGSGGWRGLVGNSSCHGVAVEHTGHGPSPAQLLVAIQVHAACLEAPGSSRDAGLVFQHFEWTSRKIDFRDLAPYTPDSFRAAVAAALTTIAPLEDDDMLMVRHPTGATVLLAGGRLGGIKAAADARALTAAGVPLVDVTDATWQEWHVKFGAKS